MKANERVQKKEQHIAKLERHLMLQKIKKRKADTRRKIELGALLETRERLSQDYIFKKHVQRLF